MSSTQPEKLFWATLDNWSEFIRDNGSVYLDPLLVEVGKETIRDAEQRGLNKLEFGLTSALALFKAGVVLNAESLLTSDPVKITAQSWSND